MPAARPKTPRLVLRRNTVAKIAGQTVQRFRPRQRSRRRAYAAVIAFSLVLGIFSYLTNPFVRFSLVFDPYKEVLQTEQGQFGLNESDELFLRDRFFYRQLAYLKSGWYIVTGKFAGGPKASGSSVDEIIAEIHQLRFNPEEPFLISGDHFSVLYPRSLGIFYHSLLDPRTALSKEDWQNRQLIYLKTTAYALQVFAESDRLSTTVVPIGPKSVALINVYAPPVDTLYSMLYALRVMQDERVLLQQYPFGAESVDLPQLGTKDAAAVLTQQYKTSLQQHWERYRTEVFDEQTNLIKREIRLSGTKDMAQRSSAFYDNVIFWRTAQLAMELGVIERDQEFLDKVKTTILSTFWLEESGYFLDDLSPESIQNEWYSGDWLIAYQTGFLNPAIPAEREMLERSIAYLQRNALDQPFGVQYSADQRPEQLYWPVRVGAPDYGSTSIWSNWGMEYIKLLAHLSVVTGNQTYMFQANQQISAYSYNIKRYRGYPELYDSDGDFFQQRFYKSVRQTGWVVSFEQARAMVQGLTLQR
jgi:hypothetical protein